MRLSSLDVFGSCAPLDGPERTPTVTLQQNSPHPCPVVEVTCTFWSGMLVVYLSRGFPMRRVGTWLPGVVLAALGSVVLLTPTSSAADIGFVEDFALAKDRAAALKQLIPGTD